MRTKPHWPTRSPLNDERPATEHLLSERALRERLQHITEDADNRERWRDALDAAIRESRIS
jgi:hypothetical protein